MNKESFEFLNNLINEKSKECINKFSKIIEDQLKIIHEEYAIPKDKLILQCYPENKYSIGIVVSEFKIDHEFTYNPPKEI